MSAIAQMTTGPCHILMEGYDEQISARYRVEPPKGKPMNNIVWIVGAVVIVLVVLSVLGLR